METVRREICAHEAFLIRHGTPQNVDRLNDANQAVGWCMSGVIVVHAHPYVDVGVVFFSPVGVSVAMERASTDATRTKKHGCLGELKWSCEEESIPEHRTC